MNSKETGMRIRAHRTLLGMTQEDLARSAGTSPSFIGHIERGTRNAGPETLNAIARALGIPCAILSGTPAADGSGVADANTTAELREDSAVYRDEGKELHSMMLREIIELLEDKT